MSSVSISTEPDAVSDSRFVVYYWHVTADRRLIFGGGETYTHNFPGDIAAFVRPHLARVYPKLANVPVSHAWGGTLGITFNRMPYIARPRPNVWVAAGYSGQGVMLGQKFNASACLDFFSHVRGGAAKPAARHIPRR